MISSRLRTTLCAIVALIPAAAHAQAREKGPLNQYGNPARIDPRPTKVAIDEADLRTRLYIFADDSMMGRAAGTVGNQKGTDYIAAELKKLGLEPAGDNGTYFQALPFGTRTFTSESQLSAGGRDLRIDSDFLPIPTGVQPGTITLQNAQVIFGGVAGDTAQQIATPLAAGRIVVLLPNPVGAGGGRGGRGGGGGGGGGGRGGRGGFGGGPNARFAGALAIVTVDLDSASAQQRAVNRPTRSTMQQQPQQVVAGTTMLGPSPAPVSIRVTRAAAEAMMGAPLGTLQPGTAGARVSGRLVLEERRTPEFGRNVVAILRGSDPTLRNEFVAIGAHNDHDPIQANPVDHDSVKAYLAEVYRQRMADGRQVLAADTTMNRIARERVNMTAIRKRGPARLDSIRNGADDDGSGSMALLEMAEYFALAPEKPKRSVLFVWHTGEETGLQGSRFYTDNPTVPITSIVAQLNMDMIGRGRADDIPGGGPDYLAVVGSNRLSSDLATMVTTANKQQKSPFKLDYRFDDSVTWAGYNNIYGRSDHANYANKGIPIAFFFTGLHADYHQLTDEPQYIDYPHYSRIANYIRDLAVTVANNPERPKVDRRIAQ
ncbi:MAG TPA: M28 family peptidase [Gemmatimonadaceae bacterium]|nr:M28 family peptidase [Gemmatimonadaceae bacterium]